MTPANAVGLVLSAPTVRVLAPSVMVPPVLPPPVSEPIVSFEESVRLAPLTLAMTTAEESGIAEPPAAVSVPALIVITPVNVLTPLRVTVPAVVFVTAPVPARMAETVPCCSA